MAAALLQTSIFNPDGFAGPVQFPELLSLPGRHHGCPMRHL